jgi:hypothetical protein
VHGNSGADDFSNHAFGLSWQRKVHLGFGGRMPFCLPLFFVIFVIFVVDISVVNAFVVDIFVIEIFVMVLVVHVHAPSGVLASELMNGHPPSGECLDVDRRPIRADRHSSIAVRAEDLRAFRPVSLQHLRHRMPEVVGAAGADNR